MMMFQCVYSCCYLLLVGCTIGFFGTANSFSLFQNRGAAVKSISKENFLNSLDDTKGFNDATKERTNFVSAMTLDNPTSSPGATSSFGPVAAGTWRVVYAPHIFTGGKLLGGSFSPVVYILEADGTMISHAKYNLPFIGSGWLSVSGTYDSEDGDQICRVDFDKAWIKVVEMDAIDNDTLGPYGDLDAVPPSIWKDVINAFGKFFFIDSVSVFPVSYLDKDTIVFDFELLGTRICARKVSRSDWLN